MHFVLFALSMLALSYESDSSISLNNYLDRYFQEAKPHYEVHRTDLNQDGHQDAIVYMQDKAWCDLNGCSLLVFQNTGIDFKLISKMKVSDKPIKMAQQANTGWSHLIVYSQENGFVSLQFDGASCPKNPSLSPIMGSEKVDTAKVIFNI